MPGGLASGRSVYGSGEGIGSDVTVKNFTDKRGTDDLAVTELIAVKQLPDGFRGALFIRGMDGGEGLALGHRVSELLVQDDADPRVNDVFLGRAAAAELHADQTHIFCMDAGNHTILVTGELPLNGGGGKELRMIDNGSIAALGADHLRQLRKGTATGDCVKKHLLRLFPRGGTACLCEHAASQYQAELQQITLLLTAEIFLQAARYGSDYRQEPPPVPASS